MKRIILWFVMMAVVSAGVSFAQTSPGYSDFSIVSTIYEPYPAEPGKYIDLYVKVENLGTRAAKNTTFELLPKYPFTLDDASEAIKNYGSLEPRQPVLLKYKVRVDNNAVSGNNSIDLRYKTGADGLWFTITFDIFIKPSDTILSIENVRTMPSELAAGEKANVEFTLKNLAGTQIKDISLKLDISGDDIPFAPVGSTTEKRVDRIDIGEEKTVSFEIITEASAEPKAYKVPITLSYSDEAGSSFTKNDIVGLLVFSEPELEVYMEESDTFRSGAKGNVVFSVSNTGSTQAKYVAMVLEESDDYEIIGPKRTYIGNLDSDDFDTVEYTIFVDESINDGKIPLKVTVTYKDAYNNVISKKSELDLRIYTAEELARIGAAPQQGGSGNLILFAVIAVVAYYAYRRYRKKKKD